MYSLTDIEALTQEGVEPLDPLLLPADSAVAHWPKAELTGDAAWYFAKGQPVFVAGAPSGGRLRVYADRRFLGVGEIAEDGRLAPRRLLNLPVIGAERRSFALISLDFCLSGIAAAQLQYAAESESLKTLWSLN